MRHDPCKWTNIEEIDHFIGKAKQARAALNAAVQLRDGKPVPTELWLILDYDVLDGYDEDTAKFVAMQDQSWQKWWLSGFVNKYLTMIPGGPGIWISWEEESPMLRMTTGLGFIRALWLEIAQSIANVRSLFICNGCHKVYVRTIRRPRRGARNLCPNCGTNDGYRATKREYWRRSHYHADNQLDRSEEGGM